MGTGIGVLQGFGKSSTLDDQDIYKFWELVMRVFGWKDVESSGRELSKHFGGL